MLRRLMILALAGLPAFAAMAADLIREQRIAEQIVDAILVGEPVYLADGDHEFLAIHAESELERVKGGVIVIHGRGAHPDWAEVIHPLRSALPAQGWETLALQMPVAEAEADNSVYNSLIPEAFPRIAAGVEYFKQRGVDNIILVAHSLGARMASAYLGSDGGNPDVKALVAISLPVGSGEQGQAMLEALAGIELPVLDIYGSRDIDPVLASVKQRAAAARRAKNPAYSQVVIAGADHFFIGLEADLTSRINGWMQRVIGIPKP